MRDALTKMQLSETVVKNQIKQGLAIQKLIDNKFAKNISLSDSETKEYYDKNPEQFKLPEQVKASHILIKVDRAAEEPVKKAAMEEMVKIQKRINNGEDFAALAREYSQCPSSEKGGDLGFFGRGQMVPPFEKAAFALKPGEVSGIVETEFGYHIIKVTDKRDSMAITYEDVKDKLKNYLKKRKEREEVGKYVAGLRATANVEIFMNENP